MLSPCDAQWLFSRGLATVHDTDWISLSSGEPELVSGVVAYFDGRLLTVTGYPFADGSCASPRTIRDFVRTKIDDPSVEGLYYAGIAPIDFRFLLQHQFKRIFSQRRTPEAAEMAIDCIEVQKRRVFRQRRNAPYEARLTAGARPTAQHFHLIETLFTSRPKTAFLKEMAFSTPMLFRSSDTILIEAWTGATLNGFIALRRPFENTCTAPFMTLDNGMKYVCDFLYAQAAMEASRLGARYLNVGSSPSRGHYFFKCKWGGPIVPPAYDCLWARTPFSRGTKSGWGPRLVGL